MDSALPPGQSRDGAGVADDFGPRTEELDEGDLFEDDEPDSDDSRRSHEELDSEQNGNVFELESSEAEQDANAAKELLQDGKTNTTQPDSELSKIKDDEIEDSKDMSTEEEAEDRNTKKRGHKLKRRIEKRTGFEGKEVVFVTECTQTDWKWKDRVEKTGKGKLLLSSNEVGSSSGRSESGLKSILVKPDSWEAISRTLTEGESTLDDLTGTDFTPFSLQPNDEFGIPLLDMSSDSDSSDDGMPKKVKSHRHHLPTIGPPQILKYVRESDIGKDRTSSELVDEHRLIESADYLINGASPGMFGGTCEFCGKDIKPFPTLEQQLSLPPESLHCCDEYREFVEFAMTTANRLEQDLAKKNQKINIKVHAHHGSKQARKVAKEQAVQRMRERELQRRQQEASGMQAAYFQSQEQEESRRISKGEMLLEGGKKKKREKKKKAKNREDKTNQEKGKLKAKEREEEKEDRGGVGGVGGGGAGGGGEAFSDESESEEEIVRVRDNPTAASEITGTITGVPGGGGGGKGGRGRGDGSTFAPGGFSYGGSSHSALQGFAPEVARQMKTINYQLSSQRCLEEGWTLRAPSPLDLDDLEVEVFMPQPLHPAMIVSGKINNRPLIEKFYPDGSKFVTIFPDGTGNVFYPSGNLAILIMSVSLGQYTYIIQDDCSSKPEILGVFEPTGYGCCYFANGKVRLNYDQMGGIELDMAGGRKRVWSWRDQETHVHAPPYQPIVFGMNRYLGIRFMAQGSIALTLTGRKRSCRFNVGANLKLVAPENLQPKGIDEDQLYIDERRIRVDTILNKVSTLLKYPKSPKVDCILPPLSVISRQQKVDKLKQDYVQSIQAQASTTKKKKKVKQSHLSPLPVISVN